MDDITSLQKEYNEYIQKANQIKQKIIELKSNSKYSLVKIRINSNNEFIKYKDLIENYKYTFNLYRWDHTTTDFNIFEDNVNADANFINSLYSIYLHTSYGDGRYGISTYYGTPFSISKSSVIKYITGNLDLALDNGCIIEYREV